MYQWIIELCNSWVFIGLAIIYELWAIIPYSTWCFCTLWYYVWSYKIKLGRFSLFWGIFNKTIVLFALVEYKMIIANLALLVLLAIHHLRSNMTVLWNSYLILYIRWLGRSICKNLASELREIISSSERVRILVARYEQELLQYKNSFISV